jgi:hypothetical protein
MVNGQGNGERTTPACGLRCRAANFAVPNGLNGMTMPTAQRRWRHAGRVRSKKTRENAQNAWRQCLGISGQHAGNSRQAPGIGGNGRGFYGNRAGILGKSAAIHGGALGIAGHVRRIRGSGLGFDGNSPGFGGSVRHGAAMAGKCPASRQDCPARLGKFGAWCRAFMATQRQALSGLGKWARAFQAARGYVSASSALRAG